MKRIILGIFLLLPLVSLCKEEIFDLSGKWQVVLDYKDNGIKDNLNRGLSGKEIILPGTTDMARIGKKDTLSLSLTKPQLLHLTRKYAYVGAAWYSRNFTIPETQKNKRIIFELERTIWQSEVWIDGMKIDETCNSLSAPHRFDITSKIRHGKEQIIVVKIDNRKKFETSQQNLAHSYTEDTQTIWNGIIGEISIKAQDKISIKNVALFPKIKSNSVKVDISLDGLNGKSERCNMEIDIFNVGANTKVASFNKKIQTEDGKISLDLSMGKDVKYWSEFCPELYEARIKIKIKESESLKVVRFGMREIRVDGKDMLINGKPLFLRGTLECCIFPLTGCPPMDKASWQKVFNTAKEWGLNHLRFHSWCPPEAAFAAADEAGFYLQVELPCWSNTLSDYPATNAFLYAEADRIMQEYGNHPSFCFWSMGNELQHDMSFTASLVGYLKAKDNRHLYTNTTFTFEKGYGDKPISNDDFFVTQWTKWGWVRGQGIFNSESPTFDKDYHLAVDSVNIPLITHEIGQYSVYPDLREIDKYTGVLDPINFKSIREDLKHKGMLDSSNDFMLASGKLAAILYKEEVERALKTRGISGFQLLDLHDFPGQGTALVGLLNAFWESKGIVEPDYFKEFCSPLTLLARFPKATYKNNENFSAQIDVSNFSDGIYREGLIKWELVDHAGAILANGESMANIQEGYNHNLTNISCNLNSITKAQKITLKVSLESSSYKNSWNIWVYPHDVEPSNNNVIITRDLDVARKLLDKGKKVLFNPQSKDVKGLEGKFVQVFWSPVHFPKQAGTMGMLCNPDHLAFKDFPTDMHTDWQWWDLLSTVKVLDVSSLEGGNSIVDMVDNFANNRKLSVMYECSVGKGKLIVTTCDISSDLDKRIVARQLLSSVLDYMNSENFNPMPIENANQMWKMLVPGDKDIKHADAKSIY